MATLNELAQKLQTFLINSQRDAHNSRTLNKTRYNNLKLKIDPNIKYAHVIIVVGISEATYDIDTGTKTDGSLGPDEKYIYKWIGNSQIKPQLREIYLKMTELIDLEEEQEAINEELQEELKAQFEGSAGESKIDDRPSRRHKKNNFRRLMLPSEFFEEEENIHKRPKPNMEVTPTEEEQISADYEEYDEESDLEMYKETQFESLAEESKKHDFLNFIKDTFGQNSKKK